MHPADVEKCWADKFTPAAIGILGGWVPGPIRVATQNEDRHEASDLVYPGGTVSLRVRRYSQIRWARDFTMRAARPGGTPTEVEKVRAGYGNFLFFGFSNERETGFACWFIGDLGVFRAELKARPERYLCDRWLRENKSDGVLFYAWPVGLFPPWFVVAGTELNKTVPGFHLQLNTPEQGVLITRPALCP